MKKYIHEKLCIDLDKIFVIYHAWDDRLCESVNQNNNNIYYIGDTRKLFLKNKKIFQHSFNDILKWDAETNNNGYHYTYVKKNVPLYNYSTSTKLSTACRLNSLFICNKIPVYNELLGKNYPLYISSDGKNIDEVINYAQKIFGTDEYDKIYKKYNTKIKKNLSPEAIVNKYVEMFNSISGKETLNEYPEIKNRIDFLKRNCGSLDGNSLCRCL